MIINFYKGAGGGSGSGYTLPIASEETLGGVKIGSGITIDEEGHIGVEDFEDIATKDYVANAVSGKADTDMLSGYTTTAYTEQMQLEITGALNQKQDTLTAGDGITISGNTISATGGGSDTDEIEAVIGMAYADLNTKVDDNDTAINAKADNYFNASKLLINAEKINRDKAIEKSDAIAAAGIYYSVKSADDSIKNIIKISQSDYDLIVPDAKTLYIITE